MAIILLQTHEQTHRFCRCTCGGAAGRHVHVVDKRQSICLQAASTNTHSMLVHRAHIYTCLLRTGEKKKNSPTCRINTTNTRHKTCSHCMWTYACYLIITAVINCSAKHAGTTGLHNVKWSESTPEHFTALLYSEEHTPDQVNASCTTTFSPRTRRHVCAPIRYQEIYPKTSKFIIVLFIKYYSCQKGAAGRRAFHFRWNTSPEKETELLEETALIFWSKCPRFYQMTFCTASIL